MNRTSDTPELILIKHKIPIKVIRILPVNNNMNFHLSEKGNKGKIKNKTCSQNIFMKITEEHEMGNYRIQTT